MFKMHSKRKITGRDPLFCQTLSHGSDGRSSTLTPRLDNALMLCFGEWSHTRWGVAETENGDRNDLSPCSMQSDCSEERFQSS